MARKSVIGTLYRIELTDTLHTFARELAHPDVAIYDAKNVPETPIEAVVGHPILFIVSVHDRAFRRWKKIGKVALAPDGIAIPDRFMQDIADPHKCKIVSANGDVRSASIEECDGLERVAVWDAEHVEDRIRDHYAGKPNVWLESLELKRA